METLWPVFHTKWTPEPALGKRTAPDGQDLKGYKRPALNPDFSSKKLIPKPVPRCTKSVRKKSREAAIGKNNMMSNYIISSSTATTLSKLSTDPKPATPDQIHPDEQHPDTQDQWINDKVMVYQNKPRFPQADRDTQLKLQTEKEWNELNHTINHVSEKYKKQHKDNPKFEYPHLLIDELREFNNRRKELTLAKAPSPAIKASVLTAQSTAHRSLLAKGVIITTGISRAKRVRSQANHVQLFRELSFPQQGNMPHTRAYLTIRRSLKLFTCGQVTESQVKYVHF